MFEFVYVLVSLHLIDIYVSCVCFGSGLSSYFITIITHHYYHCRVIIIVDTFIQTEAEVAQ